MGFGFEFWDGIFERHRKITLRLSTEKSRSSTWQCLYLFFVRKIIHNQKKFISHIVKRQRRSVNLFYYFVIQSSLYLYTINHPCSDWNIRSLLKFYDYLCIFICVVVLLFVYNLNL